MKSKHPNGYDNYIVIGGKRRWFETPISSEHSTDKQADDQEQTSSAKEKTVA
mgnify:FL=1